MPKANSKPPACEVHFIDSARVKQAKKKITKTYGITELAETFRVLSDPMRLKIIIALQRVELCVCDLATLFGVTRPAISHHLKILRKVRLVKYRREGKLTYYALEDQHIDRLIEIATEHIAEAKRELKKESQWV